MSNTLGTSNEQNATSSPSEQFRSIKAKVTGSVLSGAIEPTDATLIYANAIDGWITEIFERATKGKERGCALIAVGGYGRKELYPGSDLDLVLLHRARRDYQRVASEIWYEIWDAGIRLDHSVRTRHEALSVAGDDLKVVLGLLDGRVICGDAGVTERLLGEIPALWRRNFRSMLNDFDRQVQARHEQYGDLAFLLEPDLKQSNGGLRDLAALRALKVALPQLAPLVDHPGIAQAEAIIKGCRVIVHSSTNSANDRLLLQEQDRVATFLHLDDADVLMAKVAEAGRTISTTATQAWRRVRHEFLSANKVAASTCDLGRGILLTGGEVALAPDAVASDPTLIIAIGRAAVERNVPVEIESLDRLARQATTPVAPWPHSLREDFIALLSAGSALITVVESLDQRHLFELLIPEWTAVRNRPQRNAYHRFTVDRHLLETVSLCAQYLDQVSRPDLLIMGALLHDIGKGYPGDHSQVGGDLAQTIGRRMGFNETDVATIVALVAFHLVVPEFAIRRNLDDPSTAIVVARVVGNRLTLELLAALAEVDGKATGSAAWSPWKSELIGILVERVGKVLDGEQVDVTPPLPTEEELQILHEGRVAIRVSGRNVTVVAPDRPGLLAVVAGVLALHGYNVKRATANEGIPGMAIEVFQVEPTFDRAPDWAKVEKELIQSLEGNFTLNERLVERDNTYARARRPVAARPARMRVQVDNDTSTLASIVEVQAADRLGLLHDIASVFATEQLDVVAALVDTLGHEVIDTFYVRDGAGKKLSLEMIEQVSASLEEVAGSVI